MGHFYRDQLLACFNTTLDTRGAATGLAPKRCSLHLRPVLTRLRQARTLSKFNVSSSDSLVVDDARAPGGTKANSARPSFCLRGDQLLESVVLTPGRRKGPTGQGHSGGGITEWGRRVTERSACRSGMSAEQRYARTGCPPGTLGSWSVPSPAIGETRRATGWPSFPAVTTNTSVTDRRSSLALG